MRSEAEVVPIQCSRSICQTCSLAGECLARDDEPGSDERYSISVTPRIYRRRDHVFRSGEAFESVYMVRSGVVKTYVIAPNGDEQVVGFHFPGDLIGLDAVDRGSYVCHAQVLDTSSLCTLPFDKLTRLCMHSRVSYARLMKAVARQLESDKSLLLLLGQKTADQRIAAFLLHISEVQARLGFSSVEFNLAMSRSDIASYLSLAVETVSRVLSRFQEGGIVEVNRTEVRILDYAGLVALVDEDTDDLSMRRAVGLH